MFDLVGCLEDYSMGYCLSKSQAVFCCVMWAMALATLDKYLPQAKLSSQENKIS